MGPSLEITLVLGIFSALAAVLAFLVLFSSALARAKQESLLKEHLETREKHTARRLTIWRERREQLRRLNDWISPYSPAGEEQPSAGEKDSFGDELARICQQIKESPEDAATYLKTLVEPHIQG